VPGVREQVLILTSIEVILSLVINGSTTKILLVKLGILKPQAVKVELLLHSINEMEDYADKHCSHLKVDRLICNPDWERVKELSHIDTKKIVNMVDLEAIQGAEKHSDAQWKATDSFDETESLQVLFRDREKGPSHIFPSNFFSLRIINIPFWATCCLRWVLSPPICICPWSPATSCRATSSATFVRGSSTA
jgi:hypothetical protein